MMQTITFECEIITPLVMNGADGINPELRPPSIKGALRFWWRALHGHLPLDDRKDANGRVNEKGLRTIEGEIFGDTKQRSHLLIRIENLSEIKLNKKEVALLPHKVENKKAQSWVEAFSEHQTFKVRFDFDTTFISKEKLKSLFILTCTLGGFGKRSRRGFGSLTIKGVEMPMSEADIKLMIKIVSPNFEFNKNHFNSGYPYIKSIEIGKIPIKKITDEIIEASHDVKDNEYQRVKDEDDYSYYTDKQGKECKTPNSNFEKALGDGAKRFASPIYVSTIGQRIIITTLNSIPPSKGRYIKDASKTLQDEFKTKLK